jgi:two-component system nitrogen regulation response regulator NtrX
VAHEQILVVDDDQKVLKSVVDILRDEGYRVSGAGDGSEALRAIQKSPPDLVILDIWMPGIDGLATLDAIKRIHQELPVIMISGHGTIETAVKATKLGAFDYLEKPLDLEKVHLAVRHALDLRRLEWENRALRETLDRRYEIVGESKAIRMLREQILSAAPSNGRVLIRGESGTGKELIARAIHRNSARSEMPFVVVNCAAIPEELIESELFGHERGAFTGATGQRRGKFELADGATIFLDEVGDMSLKTQAKVLRVLQEQTFERVGGSEGLTVDVRVIAASNKDLLEEIRRGAFREDLYYRLSVIPFEVPPLRERQEDIPLLARYFLQSFCQEHGKPEKELSPEALELLVEYQWPGNVRELRNVIERMVIMVPARTIQPLDLASSLRRAGPKREVWPAPDGTLRDARSRFEREFILRRLEESQWNVTKAAERLGIERSNLHRKMRAYGIEGSGR